VQVEPLWRFCRLRTGACGGPREWRTFGRSSGNQPAKNLGDLVACLVAFRSSVRSSHGGVGVLHHCLSRFRKMAGIYQAQDPMGSSGTEVIGETYQRIELLLRQIGSRYGSFNNILSGSNSLL